MYICDKIYSNSVYDFPRDMTNSYTYIEKFIISNAKKLILMKTFIQG